MLLAEFGRVERLGLGRQREVDGGEHRPLDVQVEDPLGRLYGLAREPGDLVGRRERRGQHLVDPGTRDWPGRSPPPAPR